MPVVNRACGVVSMKLRLAVVVR